MTFTKKEKMLDAEKLREILHYGKESGVMT